MGVSGTTKLAVGESITGPLTVFNAVFMNKSAFNTNASLSDSDGGALSNNTILNGQTRIVDYSANGFAVRGNLVLSGLVGNTVTVSYSKGPGHYPSGSQRITQSGVIGIAGRPLWIYYAASFATFADPSGFLLRNGSTSSGTLYVKSGPVIPSSYIEFGDRGMFFPNGCYAEFADTTSSMSVSYSY